MTLTIIKRTPYIKKNSLTMAPRSASPKRVPAVTRLPKTPSPKRKRSPRVKKERSPSKSPSKSPRKHSPRKAPATMMMNKGCSGVSPKTHIVKAHARKYHTVDENGKRHTVTYTIARNENARNPCFHSKKKK